MQDNKWARLLAYATGLVNQRLLLQNEYLAVENRILRSHLPTRLRLSDPQRSTLAEEHDGLIHIGDPMNVRHDPDATTGISAHTSN